MWGSRLTAASVQRGGCPFAFLAGGRASVSPPPTSISAQRARSLDWGTDLPRFLEDGFILALYGTGILALLASLAGLGMTLHRLERVNAVFLTFPEKRMPVYPFIAYWQPTPSNNWLRRRQAFSGQDQALLC